MSESNELAEMESLFLALSDKTRLKLLNLMREGEVFVGLFTEILGVSQPKISRHLAYLRSAGIVSARRDGKWMNYKIEIPSNHAAVQILENALDWLESQQEMRADYEKMINIRTDAITPINPAKMFNSQTFAEPNIKYQRRKELDTFLL